MRPCSSCCSVTKSYLTFVTPWTAAHQASLTFTISCSFLKLMSIRSVIPSKHPILVAPFSSCPQSFPALGSFTMSQLFESGGQIIGASALVLPLNIQGWFSLKLTGFISFTPRDSQEYFQHHRSKTSVLHAQTSLWYSTQIHTWLLEKPYLWIYSHSFGKVMSLLFNMPSSFLIAFLLRSMHLLISWLQPSSTLMIVPRK